MKRQAAKAQTPGFHALSEDLEGFAALSQVLHQEVGILMEPTPTNRLKMANRLARVLAEHKFTGYAPYLKKLRERDSVILEEFISALTTNTTSFFREPAHFEALRNILPEVCHRKQSSPIREIRTWSAAVSTGEEAYSIAMCMLETLPLGHGMELKLLGTDVDREALARASLGKFEAEQLAELPANIKKKYFRADRGRAGQSYVIDPRVRSIIRFAPLNLRSPAYPFRFSFDIIFCRNVLIYFDAKTSMQVIERLSQALAPGGFLFIGHAELGLVRSSSLRPRQMGVYEKISSAISFFKEKP